AIENGVDRSSFYLADKMPLWSVESKEDVDKIFNNQLEKTKAGYFDYYLMHAFDDGIYEKFIKYDVYDYLKAKKAEGKIKNLGFSFHGSIELLNKLVNDYKWDFAQIQLNYQDWAGEYNSKEQYEILTAHKLPVIVMEPVKGGSLANLCEKSNSIFKEYNNEASIASWALRYVATKENVALILSGMSNMEQLTDNINTFTNFKPISKEEQMVIDKALNTYVENKLVSCTGCRYCLDACQSGVDIPAIFKAYNEKVKAGGNFRKMGNIDNCVECGLCMEHCPQKIEIPTVLKGLVK
ncbi:MAG: aldo/keto reductase, partial [Oscillospiraceae bacterium]